GPAFRVGVRGVPGVGPGPVALAARGASLPAAPAGGGGADTETVVPRGAWASTVLADGDRVEVLTAVQGG
ncbi:MoaD/ThiS family protein, partial [Streptomyces fradiae]|uniref:sulfur carrier protein ThiS n=1 Tax=Streptomyces fradiae TaxID=1906 RepID=UPI003692092B